MAAAPAASGAHRLAEAVQAPVAPDRCSQGITAAQSSPPCGFRPPCRPGRGHHALGRPVQRPPSLHRRPSASSVPWRAGPQAHRPQAALPRLATPFRLDAFPVRPVAAVGEAVIGPAAIRKCWAAPKVGIQQVDSRDNAATAVLCVPCIPVAGSPPASSCSVLDSRSSRPDRQASSRHVGHLAHTLQPVQVHGLASCGSQQAAATAAARCWCAVTAPLCVAAGGH